MAVSIAPQFTQRTYRWTAWKAIELVKGGPYQYDDDGDTYTIWFYDGPEVHLCTIWKDSVPDSIINNEGYSQAQNDSDKTDWETNYKPTANGVVEPRADDGRLTIRVTTAKKTKNFKLRAVSFYSSKANSQRSFNPIADADYGDVTLTLKKWDSGTSTWVAATDSDATKTIVDWDPTYAYEIIGGWVDLPSDLKDGTTDAWFLACVGVPDYAVYGLAVDFVSEVNLEAVTTQKVNSDGRATQYLSPTIAGGVNYHTNRLRWIVKHPAGLQKRFQIFVETFV